MSSTATLPAAASRRHAATGPGLRWCSGGMPLNRCVTVGRVRSRAALSAASSSAASARDAAVGARIRIGVAQRRRHPVVGEQSAAGHRAGQLRGVGHGPQVSAGRRQHLAEQLRGRGRGGTGGPGRRSGRGTGTGPRSGCPRSAPRPPGRGGLPGRAAGPRGRRSPGWRAGWWCRCGAGSPRRSAAARSSPVGKSPPAAPWQCRSTRPGRMKLPGGSGQFLKAGQRRVIEACARVQRRRCGRPRRPRRRPSRAVRPSGPCRPGGRSGSAGCGAWDSGSRGSGRRHCSASANQPVMVAGWVMAVPTTTANAPASSAWRAWAGVWMRPSAISGMPSPAAAICSSSSRSGPWVLGRSPV